MSKFQIFSCVVCLLFAISAQRAVAATVTFEGLLTNPNEFYNATNSAGWSDGGVLFNHNFQDFGGGFTGWTGWRYSNVTDTTTAGFGNQYASASGGGSDGAGGTTAGETYVIGFGDGAFFNLPSAMMVTSVDLTNTTYARLSMRDGDSFAKQFGGLSGNDPDFFRVTLTGFAGLNASGATTGAVTVDLADFTDANNANDFILDQWSTVDLTGLGSAQSVSVAFASSDVGAFGINTPTYFALDNLTLVAAVPEPSSLGLLAMAIGAVMLRRRR